MRSIDDLIATLQDGSEQEKIQIAEAVLQALKKNASPVGDPTVAATEDLLLELGIPDGICGTTYIKDAVQILINQPHHVCGGVMSIYDEIAGMHDTTQRKVERGIRHAIEVGCTRGDLSVFVNAISPTKGKPTNSEFIFRVVSVVRRRCGMS